MAKDFKASQVLTTQIIASSSNSSKPSLVILSASSPSVDYVGGGINGLPAAVGGDVFVFVSGTKSSRGSTTRGVTLFGGDIVVSGTAYDGNGNTFGSTTPGGSTTQVQFNDASSFGGDSGFTYNKITDTISVGSFYVTSTTANNWISGSLNVSGNVNVGDSPSDNLVVSSTSYFGRSIDVGRQSLTVGGPAVTGSLIVRGGPNAPTFFGTGSQTIHLVGTGTAGVGAGIIFGDYYSDTGVGIMEDTSDGMLVKAKKRINIVSTTEGVGVNKNSPTSGYALHVGGKAYIDSNLKVDGSITLGDSSGDSLQVTANSWFDNDLSVSGSVTIAQNLTVNGTTTTVNTVNLVVKDPLIYFGSGTTSTNQNGGIALASGSNTTNQALVWGRVSTDTWGAGKQDVTAGTESNLTNMTLVPIRASKFEIGGSYAILTSSDGVSVTMQAGGGGIINIVPGNDLKIGGYTFPVGVTGSHVRLGNISEEFNDQIPPQPGIDSYFFVSGSKGSKDSSTRGTSVFGGDVVISGTLHGGSPLKVSGSMALSGSLRLQTQDSAPSVGSNESVLYVLNDAGTKKLYWKNSDGTQQQVGTGGGSSAGSEGQVQYANDVGGFAASSDFNYDAANYRLSVPSGTFYAITGSLTSLSDGTAYLKAGSNIVLSTGTNGSVTISSTGGGGGTGTGFNDGGNKLNTTSSVAFAGNLGSSYYPASAGADTFFYVSGSVGSRNSNIRGAAVFGGDSFVSGNAFVSALIVSNSNNVSFPQIQLVNGFSSIGLVASNKQAFYVSEYQSGKVHFDIDTLVGRVLIGQDGDTYEANSDVYLYVSGGNGRGSSSPNVTLFGGDVVSSGTIAAQSLTGSLTKLADGTSYLIGGTGISITTGSSGAVTTAILNSVVATVSGTTFTGVVKANAGLSGSLTQLTDGTPYLIAGSNVTLSTGTNGAVTIASTGGGTPGGIDTQVQFNDGGSAFGGDAGLTYTKGTDTLNVTNISMTATADQTWNFRDNSGGALNISAGTGDPRWTFNTGDGQERLGFWDNVKAAFGDINDPDLTIYHDGTNSLIRNKTGVLVLSGTASGLEVTGTTKFVQGLSGSLTKLIDGSSYLIAGTNVTITTGSNGAVTIASTGGGGGGSGTGFNDGGNKLNTTSSVAFAGGLGTSYYADNVGADVVFFVSGAISGSAGNQKVAVFGGDVVISGSLVQGFTTTAAGLSSHAEGYNTVANGNYSHAEGGQTTASGELSHAEGDSTTAAGIYSHAEGTSATSTGDYSHAEGDGTTAAGGASHAEGYQNISAYYASHAEGYRTIASASYSHTEGAGTIASGTYQHVSGKYNKRGNNFSLFVIGDGTATDDASRSDILRVNSGSVGGTGRVEVTGTLATTLGLSGSLTKLTDGTSYLIAGTNVTITTGSSGAVTISSTAPGTPGGSTTQVQFNDGGSFGGSAGLTYNKTTQTLSVGNLVVTGSTTTVSSSNLVISDSVIYFGSGSTSSNSNGGIALASGSAVANQAMVWGRVANNTWGAGRLDVTAGTVTDLTGMSLIGVRASKFEIGAATAYISSSDGVGIILSGSTIVTGSLTATLGLSGSLTKLRDGTSYLIAGTGISIATGSNGAVTITSTAAGGDTFFSSTTADSIYTTGSVAIRGSELTVDSPTDKGADVFFYVSGTQLQKGSANGKTSVFGGDVVVSGVLHGGVSPFTNDTSVNINANNIVLYGGPIQQEATRSDISVFVSGAIGSKNGSNKGATVFGGDVVISGTLHGGSPLKIAGGLQLTGTLDMSSDGSSKITATAMSGSLTKLADGTSYLIAGDNVTITSGSNGSVTISSIAGGGGGGGDAAASYVVISSTGSLSNERVLTAGTGIFINDGGANSNVTLAINDSIVATVSGTTFSGIVKANSGISGSLTKLTDGTSYLIAGNNVNILTGSNGSVTIASTATAGGDSFFSSTTQYSIFTSGSAAFVGSEIGIDSPQDKGLDTFFYVSGSRGSKDGPAPGVSMFGGDLMLSGSTYVASGSSILPVVDRGSDLGSAAKRWGNVYTGDLHLRNDRGDWTIVEEEDYLCVVNNKTGKKFKMALIPLEE